MQEAALNIVGHDPLVVIFCEDPLLSSHRLTYVIHWIDDQLLNGKDLARCVALDWRFCA